MRQNLTNENMAPQNQSQKQAGPKASRKLPPMEFQKAANPHDTPWSPEVTETEPDLFTTLQFRRAVSGPGEAIISPHDSGAQDTFFHAL